MKNYKIRLIDKLLTIITTCILVYSSFYAFPVIVLTGAFNIDCDKDGNCSAYRSVIGKEYKKIKFNLNTNSIASCECTETRKNNKMLYQIIIKNNNCKSTIPYQKLDYTTCQNILPVIVNNKFNSDRTIKYKYYWNRLNTPWYCWLGWLIGLLISIFSLVVSYFTIKHNSLDDIYNEIQEIKLKINSNNKI